MQLRITHFLLRIIKNDSETVKVVKIKSANLKPMSGKMIRFGKRIGKFTLQDAGYSGIKYDRDRDGNIRYHKNGKPIYKYQSPFFREYNREGVIADEIIIYAEPGKITAYIFYDKTQQKLYFGLTDASFTFKPEEVIHIYSEQFSILEDTQSIIDVCFVDNNKVNKYRRDFRRSPVPVVALKFNPRIFSSTFEMQDIENPIFGEPNYEFEFIFPDTSIRKKEAMRTWLTARVGIPRQRRDNNPQVVHRVMPDGNLSDEEPLDVRRERLRRQRIIEETLEELNFLPGEITNTITLENLPEPDERGYITFGNNDRLYDMNNPYSLFERFYESDTGSPYLFLINGRRVLFNAASDLKPLEGSYSLYWCPTDGSIGVKYKELRDNYNDNGGSGDGQGERRQRDNTGEHEPAHMVNKYIYQDVINGQTMDGIMVPTIIDIYSKSNYPLARIDYSELDIRYKSKKYITKDELKTSWERRFELTGNGYLSDEEPLDIRQRRLRRN